MATVTHVCSLDYVVRMLGEDAELLDAIIYNDDNLTYGAIISIHTGPEETITALTNDGIDELKDMLGNARVTTETWHAFLDDFVDDEDPVARIKAQSPRWQPAGYDTTVARSCSCLPAPWPRQSSTGCES